ncbi:MAG TPA: hypothetical protein VMV56_10205 [Williamwhitmania sp.]|nr:hypothetical protein [Williamwhitmania sp.]
MAIKTVLLLFIITILGQLSAFALYHNGNMELIIEPKAEQANMEQPIAVRVYNGYELVDSKTTLANKPVTIILDLYCNYIVSIEQNGVLIKKYKISTEVPPKEIHDWKMTLSIPIYKNGSNQQLAVVELPPATINYNSNNRQFTCTEPMHPMADQIMVDTLEHNDSNIQRLNQQ